MTMNQLWTPPDEHRILGRERLDGGGKLIRTRGTGWIRWVPGLQTSRSYDRSWLRHDIVAGLVMTTMLVPVGIAYAEATGLPGIAGLYATIVPLLAYALFGPSRILARRARFRARGRDPVRRAAAVRRRSRTCARRRRDDGARGRERLYCGRPVALRQLCGDRREDSRRQHQSGRARGRRRWH